MTHCVACDKLMSEAELAVDNDLCKKCFKYAYDDVLMDSRYENTYEPSTKDDYISLDDFIGED